MKREQDKNGVLELGVASTDTLGVPVGRIPEGAGYFPLGLHDQ